MDYPGHRRKWRAAESKWHLLSPFKINAITQPAARSNASHPITWALLATVFPPEASSTGLLLQMASTELVDVMFFGGFFQLLLASHWTVSDIPAARLSHMPAICWQWGVDERAGATLFRCYATWQSDGDTVRRTQRIQKKEREKNKHHDLLLVHYPLVNYYSKFYVNKRRA